MATTVKTLNEYKAETFEKIALKLTSKETFGFVTEIVMAYMNFEMTGKEKFAEVVKIVKPLIVSSIPFIVEAIVQLAYVFLKSKMASEVK